jgi:ArsR family transcriptional regulator
MPRTLHEFKAELFRSLAHPVRIQILEELRVAGSLTVSELQRRVDVESSNLSQHLSVLRARSVVASDREGTSIRYSVPDASVFVILDAARALFENHLSRQNQLLADSAGGSERPG